jgi:hypothetical protein
MTGWNHLGYQETTQPLAFAVASAHYEIAQAALWADGIWGELEEYEEYPEISSMPCHARAGILSNLWWLFAHVPDVRLPVFRRS